MIIFGLNILLVLVCQACVLLSFDFESSHPFLLAIYHWLATKPKWPVVSKYEHYLIEARSFNNSTCVGECVALMCSKRKH